MQARKKRVLTVLCIGSAILAWRGYSLMTKYAPSVAQADANTKPAELAPTVINSAQADEHMDETWEKQRLAAELAWGRNPCATLYRPADATAGADQANMPPSATPPPTPPIKLSGVSRSGDQWLAAVAGNIVRVGDTAVEGYRVIKITQHSIMLESAGWTFTYAMGAKTAVVQPSLEEK